MSNFIVFEGPNGSGKSTLMSKVVENLQSNTSYNIISTCEPGGNVENNQDNTRMSIRELLLDNKSKISDKTELMLFLADRAQHYNEVIKPNLNKKNTLIISDRFWESTLVYQSLVKGVIEEDDLNYMHNFITENTKPDTTFIITSDKSHCDEQDRIGNGGFRSQAVNAYRNLNKLSEINYNIKIIDTTRGKWDNYIADITNYIKNRYLHLPLTS